MVMCVILEVKMNVLFLVRVLSFLSIIIIIVVKFQFFNVSGVEC